MQIYQSIRLLLSVVFLALALGSFVTCDAHHFTEETATEILEVEIDEAVVNRKKEVKIRPGRKGYPKSGHALKAPMRFATVIGQLAFFKTRTWTREYAQRNGIGAPLRA